jgi:hypothetical protein
MLLLPAGLPQKISLRMDGLLVPWTWPSQRSRLSFMNFAALLSISDCQSSLSRTIEAVERLSGYIHLHPKYLCHLFDCTLTWNSALDIETSTTLTSFSGMLSSRIAFYRCICCNIRPWSQRIVKNIWLEQNHFGQKQHWYTSHNMGPA